MSWRRVSPWVRRLLTHLLSEHELRAVISELDELNEVREGRVGATRAARAYSRSARQLALQLLGQRMRGIAGAGLSLRAVVQSLRALSRVPVFSGSIVASVGLGIGGCAAVFSVVNALFLQPLPYPDADRLHFIVTESAPNWYPLSVVDFQALKAQQTQFASVAAYMRRTRTYTADDGVAERLAAVFVTPDYFRTLGISPVLGRDFVGEDGLPGAPATVIVSDGFAELRLGGRHNALGQLIRLDGNSFEVVGIMPPDLGPLGSSTPIFPALRMQTPGRKGPFSYWAIGRLKEGVSPAGANEELAAINRNLFPLWEDSYQDDRATWGARPMADVVNGDPQDTLVVLLGAVLLVLLIATANAANLFTARVSQRRSELAVRSALGASRKQIVGHLLVETGILTVGGAAFGLLVAWGAIQLLPVVASGYLPRLSEVRLDPAVTGFALALSLLCGLLFGVLPAMTGVGKDGLGGQLRAAGRSSSLGGGKHRVHRFLVVAQLAVVVPLLTGAGLLVATLNKLQEVDPGFEAEGLLSMRASPSRSAYGSWEVRVALWDRVLAEVGAIPGVFSVGLADGRPPSRMPQSNNFDLEDDPTPPGESQPQAPWVAATPGYFEALGVPLFGGRMLRLADIDADAPSVILVDQEWEERFFPGGSAIGKRLKSGGCAQCDWTTIVGIVGNVPYAGTGTYQGGAVYSPTGYGVTDGYLYVRSAGNASAVMPLVREALRSIDPTLPLTEILTAEELLSNGLAGPRQLSRILTWFSATAFLLALMGLYGTTAYGVQRRRAEIAIRIALGGSPGAVSGRVVRQGMGLVLGGLLFGLVGALAVTRVMSSLLFEVTPRDPLTLLGVSGLLLGVALLATLVPAMRAANVDPTVVLREE